MNIIIVTVNDETISIPASNLISVGVKGLNIIVKYLNNGVIIENRCFSISIKNKE